MKFFTQNAALLHKGKAKPFSIIRPAFLLGSAMVIVSACSTTNEKASPVAPVTSVTALKDTTVLFSASGGTKDVPIKILTKGTVDNITSSSADVGTTLLSADLRPYIVDIDRPKDKDSVHNAVQYYGHIWGTGSPEPHLSDSGTGGRTVNRGPLSPGVFKSSMTYLMPNTKYYVQPYIINYGLSTTDLSYAPSGAPDDSGAIAYGPAMQFTTGGDSVYPIKFSGGAPGTVIFNEDFKHPSPNWYSDYNAASNIYTNKADTLRKKIFLDSTGSVKNLGPGYVIRNLVNGIIHESSINLQPFLNNFDPNGNFEVSFTAAVLSGGGQVSFDFGAKKPYTFRNRLVFDNSSQIDLFVERDYKSSSTDSSFTPTAHASINGGSTFNAGDFNTFTIRKYNGYFFTFLNQKLINIRKAFYIERYGSLYKIRLDNKAELFIRNLNVVQLPN